MIIRGGLATVQSLRQSCSRERRWRFGSCGTRLVGTVAKAAHVVIGGTE